MPIIQSSLNTQDIACIESTCKDFRPENTLRVNVGVKVTTCIWDVLIKKSKQCINGKIVVSFFDANHTLILSITKDVGRGVFFYKLDDFMVSPRHPINKTTISMFLRFLKRQDDIHYFHIYQRDMQFVAKRLNKRLASFLVTGCD